MRITTAIMACALALGVAACGDDEGGGSGIAAPTDLHAEPLIGSAHLTWHDNSDDEAEFTIERMAEGGDFEEVGSVPFDTTQYHDGNLEPGATYRYRVMAIPKSGGEGAYSSEVTVTIPGDGAAGDAGAAGAGDAAAGH